MYWSEEGKENFKSEEGTQLEGCIIDFPMEPEVEAAIIDCFRSEGDIILNWWIEPNERDYKICPHFKPNPWEGKKECLFIRERQQRYTTEKIIRRVFYYSIDNLEELKSVIKSKGIISAFYVVDKEKPDSDFKYFLYTYEHHILNEDGIHHRSLFCESEGQTDFKKTVLPKILEVMIN